MTKTRIGIIGGSGLADTFAAGQRESRELDTPFGRPSSPLMLLDLDGTEVVFLKRHGEGHVLHPGAVPYRANIYALKALGVTHIVASGAVGSLREEIRPGDIVITDQVIDKTTARARTFYEGAAVHVEFAEPFCPVLRSWLIDAGKKLDDIKIHDGATYVCMEGPAFSTRAESEMHRAWGADLIGMTLLPEARLAREAELAYAHIALPTDYDCWRPREVGEAQALLEEIIGNLQQAAENSIRLIKAAIEDIPALEATPSPAHDALALAIWSDKTTIPQEEIDRLHVLWGRHFS
jgi:5'-methylthioadenosine phosphorylase